MALGKRAGLTPNQEATGDFVTERGLTRNTLAARNDRIVTRRVPVVSLALAALVGRHRESPLGRETSTGS